MGRNHKQIKSLMSTHDIVDYGSSMSNLGLKLKTVKNSQHHDRSHNTSLANHTTGSTIASPKQSISNLVELPEIKTPGYKLLEMKHSSLGNSSEHATIDGPTFDRQGRPRKTKNLVMAHG